MRGKFVFAVLLMATAAWLVAESTSFAGHHRRRGGWVVANRLAEATEQRLQHRLRHGCGSAPCETAVPATKLPLLRNRPRRLLPRQRLPPSRRCPS